MQDLWEVLKAVWFRENGKELVFNYHFLRLLLGTIAFSLWIVVIYFSNEPKLSSISVSYHTPARDAFVGWLFVVGALLLAYRGHFFYEGFFSKVAAVMAFLVAVSPTTCESINSNMCSLAPKVEAYPVLHNFAAASLFLILAFFCLSTFPRRAKSKEDVDGLNAKIRKWVYRICGIVMLGAMAYIAIEPNTSNPNPRAVFYGEVLALSAFGIAWIVAGQYFRFVARK